MQKYLHVSCQIKYKIDNLPTHVINVSKTKPEKKNHEILTELD